MCIVCVCVCVTIITHHLGSFLCLLNISLAFFSSLRYSGDPLVHCAISDSVSVKSWLACRKEIFFLNPKKGTNFPVRKRSKLDNLADVLSPIMGKSLYLQLQLLHVQIVIVFPVELLQVPAELVGITIHINKNMRQFGVVSQGKGSPLRPV